TTGDHQRFSDLKERLRHLERQPTAHTSNTEGEFSLDPLTQRGEWLSGTGPESDVVISTRVRLARNLACYPFGPCCSTEDRAAILELLRERISWLERAARLAYHDLDALSSLDRQLLLERQIISREHATGEGARGVFFDRAEQLSILINEEDHL